MNKITAIVNTKAKKQPIDSSQLASNQVIDFPKDRSYFVEKWEPAEGNHLKCVLGYGAGTWFFFAPHCDFPPANKAYSSQSRILTERDYQVAAELLGCQVAAVKAVVAVEAAGRGFLRNGKPKILFEAHWFDNFTQGKYRQSHPNLSSRRWNRSLYKGGASEWNRLEAAMRLNRAAAIKSASYGLFQVMGFHWKTCGFNSPEAYYQAQFQSEFAHLKCAVAFIKSKGLDRHLRSLNWNAFAYGYNGSGYRQNNYHNRLSAKYYQFSKM